MTRRVSLFLHSFVFRVTCYIKQLLDEVFTISGIIKVKVTQLITLTETLIISDIAKPNLIIVLLYIVLQVNKITANNFNICVLLVFRLLNAFFLKVFVEQFLRNFLSALFCFPSLFVLANFSISCSVEEANRRAMNLLRFQMPPTLLLEIMHCVRNLQIIH